MNVRPDIGAMGIGRDVRPMSPKKIQLFYEVSGGGGSKGGAGGRKERDKIVN